jgi:hypothetical protein
VISLVASSKAALPVGKYKCRSKRNEIIANIVVMLSEVEPPLAEAQRVETSLFHARSFILRINPLKWARRTMGILRLAQEDKMK